MRTYRGQCHCGAVRFQIRSDEIRTAIRCNCSICRRKGAVMSTPYYAPDEFELLSGANDLAVYRWGDLMVNNYFCKTCGIYPFHDTTVKPGHYRVNLGCVEDVEPLELEITLVDGRSF